MTNDKNSEFTDPQEQQTWDKMVNIIVNFAKKTQEIQFYKYKLAYHLQTNKIADAYNSLNSKSSLENLAAKLEEKGKQLRDNYDKEIKGINSLYETYKQMPRIQIMLDTAKNNLKKIFTYAELHKPLFTNLKEQLTKSKESQQPLENEINNNAKPE